MMIAIAMALAGQTAAQPMIATTNTAQAKPSPGKKPAKLICEKQELTGSRLGQHSVCLSEADWRTVRNQTRVDVERAQNTGIYGQ